MSRVWYGSLNNRLEENRMFTDEIKVGTGMTEYLWSDRHAYEVIDVKDQKHVTVRELSHRHVGDGCMDNNWELYSDESNRTMDMEKRGKYWYSASVWTADILEHIDEEDGWQIRLALAHNNIEIDDLRKRGKIKRLHRMNVSFGHADYHYDYEF